MTEECRTSDDMEYTDNGNYVSWCYEHKQPHSTCTAEKERDRYHALLIRVSETPNSDVWNLKLHVEIQEALREADPKGRK